MGSLENCFLGVVSASVRMSGVVIFLFIINFFATKRYTAKCRYYLWIIVIIGLLIPINLSTSKCTIQVPITRNIETKENTINSEIKSTNLSDIGIVEKTSDKVSQSPSKEISIIEILSIIWILGVFIYLGINIYKHLIFINTIKRWTYDDDIILKKYLQQTRKELNIKSKIELKRCKIIQTPMLVGIIKPKILMPMNLFSDDEVIFILKHELTHFKRRDLLYKVIILITNGIHWFNPIIYVMNKVISYECEESCDEVIMSSESIDIRKLYGEMILNTMLKNLKQKSALATCFYGGKKEMKRRLENIIDTKIKRKRKRSGVLVACFMAVIIISSPVIFGVTSNNKYNVTTTENSNGENLKEENKINKDKTASKEIIEVQPKDKNNKDEIIINPDNPVDNNMGSEATKDSVMDSSFGVKDKDNVDEEFTVKSNYDNLDKSFIIESPIK